MPVTVTEHLGIDPEAFATTGAFNSMVDEDSRLFIDPHLLGSSSAPELISSHAKVLRRFDEVLALIDASQSRGDLAWRSAERRLKFPEIKGFCIGYSAKGSSGSGMGNKLRNQLVDSVSQLVRAGIDDPTLFELMGIFEPGIGADRMSDMVASIIIQDLCGFSERVFDGFGVKTRVVRVGSKPYRLPLNPYNNFPILLLPRDILRDLPIVHELSDIDYVSEANSELRAFVNSLVAERGMRLSRLPKRDLRDLLFSHPALMRGAIKAYKRKPAAQYDFQEDRANQYRWYAESKGIVDANPLRLTLPPMPISAEVLLVVIQIVEQFKDLVENNSIYHLLFNDDGTPRKEEAAQKTFYAIAHAHCRANDVDLSAEVNSGRGPVDFKMSRGSRAKILVETKLSTNPKLVHGFEVQIREYQKAERSQHEILVIIDVGGPPTYRRRVEQAEQKAKDAGERVPMVVYVDGRRKASASKYRPEAA